MQNQTLLLFAENKPGVLNKIFGLIRKKMYNVESITAYPTETKGISRITINFSGSETTDINQIKCQIEKVVEVTKVQNVTESPAVKRELALIKVTAKNGHRAEVSQLAEIFRGSVVDVSKETMIIQIVGNSEKVDSAIKLLEEFGVVEIARTGVTAMER